jgi:PRTRC genetic system protein A
MKNINPDHLGVPVYLKSDPNEKWPKDKMFYILSREGLMLCRNHMWFESCAKATRGPGELAEQKEFCRLNYPKIPQVLIEKAIGFFDHIYRKNGWESAVVILWNKQTEQMELICPDQKNSYGSVNYDLPNLPPHQLFIGDIHSHCNFSAKPSFTDEDDEKSRPGIHLIVGDLDRKEIDFYCDVVVDGGLFEVKDAWSMVEDYIQPDKNFPPNWLDHVKEKKWKAYTYTGYSASGGYGYTGGDGDYEDPDLSVSDKHNINEVLDEFKQHSECPTMEIVRTTLFARTKHVSYLHCERKAQKFIDNWDKTKTKMTNDRDAAKHHADAHSRGFYE